MWRAGRGRDLCASLLPAGYCDCQRSQKHRVPFPLGSDCTFATPVRMAAGALSLLPSQVGVICLTLLQDGTSSPSWTVLTPPALCQGSHCSGPSMPSVSGFSCIFSALRIAEAGFTSLVTAFPCFQLVWEMSLQIYHHTGDVLQAPCLLARALLLCAAASPSCPRECSHGKGKHFCRNRGSVCPILLGLPNPSSGALANACLARAHPAQPQHPWAVLGRGLRCRGV